MPAIRFHLFDGSFSLSNPRIVSQYNDNRLVVVETNKYPCVKIMSLGNVFVYDPKKVSVLGMYYLFFDFHPEVFPAIFTKYVDEKSRFNRYIRFSVSEHFDCLVPYIKMYMESREYLLDKKIELMEYDTYMKEIRLVKQEIFHHIHDARNLDINLHIPILPEKGKLLMREKMTNV